MSANCSTCGQALPGPNEPTGVGAVVTCTCGCQWYRGSANTVPWKQVVKTSRAPGVRWETVIREHASKDGHVLTVSSDGVAASFATGGA